MSYIRFKDIFIHSNVRDTYNEYITKYSASHSLASESPFQYYNIDDEYKYYKQKAVEKEKIVNAVRDGFLYEEHIEDNDMKKYQQMKDELDLVNDKVEKYFMIRQKIYSDIAIAINQSETELHEVNEEIQGMYLLFRGGNINSLEWSNNVREYLKKKKKRLELVKKINHWKEMITKPKYYAEEKTIYTPSQKHKVVFLPKKKKKGKKKRRKGKTKD